MSEIILTKSESSLLHYISEVNRLPMLTDEEEKKYYVEMALGNIEAAKILVSSHLRLVVKIANKYKNYGLPMMDLIGEGNVGLMRAIKTFDYKKGYKLATYSIWWIRAYIQEYILKMWSIVKIGTSSMQKKVFFNLGKVKKYILDYSGKKCFGNEEVKKASEMLGASEEYIVEMNKRLTKGDISLNAKKINGDDESCEIIDLLPAKQAAVDVIVDSRRENKKKQELLRKAIGGLDDKEQKVIKMRYITDSPATLVEIGKQLNISSERARQIEARAIEKMKKIVRMGILQESFKS
ncbi:MAG: RNA polymerase factor sigma-32 [Rickettsiales bacterium]|jgi:RNA polymerase sigma-32 factor|nr:RNA polymerase factor sigma-32 [Rickettsiales bacterium]